MATLFGSLVGGFACIVGIGCFGLCVWEALQFAVSAVGFRLTTLSIRRLVGVVTGASEEELTGQHQELLQSAGEHGVKTLKYATTFLICGMVCLFIVPTIL